MGRCGCPPATGCYCAMSAGVGFAIAGSGGGSDSFLPNLALAPVDPDGSESDQQATLLASKLFVPGGGPRTASLASLSVVQGIGVPTFTTVLARWDQFDGTPGVDSSIESGQSETVATIQLSFTGAGAAGSPIVANVGFAAGVGTWFSGSESVVGKFMYFRTGTGWYHGLIYPQFSGLSWIFQANTATSGNAMGQDPNFAVQSGDKLDMLVRLQTTYP